MSLLLTSALLASTTLSVPTCSWDRPGVDPFTGSLVESVDRYTDIPPDVRAALKQRMTERRYDDMVTIRRDAITGRQAYAPEIRDMHFGSGRVCRNVTRARWTPEHEERGLVYCASGHCLLVPTVCRNLSRIARLPQQAAGARSGAGADGRGAGIVAPAMAAGTGAEVPVDAAGGPDARAFADGRAGGLADDTAAGLAPVNPAQTAAGLPSGTPLLALPSQWPAPGAFATAAGVPVGAAGTFGPLPTTGFTPEVPQAPLAAVPEAPAVLLWLSGLAGIAAATRRIRLPA